MSKITAVNVQEKNKNRCNVFVDGEFSFACSLEIVMAERISVNKEFDEADLKEIVSRAEYLDALNKGVAYISKAIKTKRQVKEYLLRKGYGEEVAYKVIDKLKEYGYVNDVEYSKRFIASTKKTQGKKLVSFKLMSKGVKKDDIEVAYDNSEDTGKEDAFLLARKYMRNKEISRENVAKTYRYVLSRGFSYEEADYAISQFKEDN